MYVNRFFQKFISGSLLQKVSDECSRSVGNLQAVLGTNPLTLAAPGKEDTFELDMATSTVALGKVICCTFAVLVVQFCTYLQYSLEAFMIKYICP